MALDRDDPVRVSAVIDFFGPADLVALRASRANSGEPVSLMLGGTPEEVPDRYEAASPIRHVSDMAPPVLIFHGADDRLVPPEQSVALDRALGEAGVSHRLIMIPGARHGFGLHAGTTDLVPEILAFLDLVWNHKAKS